jgi:hypothetical protein
MGLHRGRYYAEKCRRTFMLTYTRADLKPTEDYFSLQPWCLSEGYLDGVQPETRRFFDEFTQTFGDFWARKSAETAG